MTFLYCHTKLAILSSFVACLILINFFILSHSVYQSEFIPLNITDYLHLKRIGDPQSPRRILLLHGAIENGKIFYSDQGKGFAWYLARQGFEVFVLDLRGRGESFPPIHRQSFYGQREAILEDIPAAMRYLETDARPLFWGAHSWGGVLLMSALAHHPEWAKHIQAAVFFGTKRRVAVQNSARLWNIELGWNRLFFLATALLGYLPARTLKVGADSETKRSHAESVHWVKSLAWRDPVSGFDYPQQLAQFQHFPILFLAGQKDACLGHPEDVRRFMQEVGEPSEYWLLSKAKGFKHDYGHIDMLTHKEAPLDHFPKVLNWLISHGLSGG